jgi:uncharacterized protein
MQGGRMRFEWDEEKNRSNQRKHGFSFEEAIQVFRDPLNYSVLERIADGEERWQTIGVVRGVLLLLVVHTDHSASGETVIRLISAREATRHERRCYENEHR